MQVTIDLQACQGYACCMMAAPELFDLDEASGKAFLVDQAPTESLRESAEKAARGCPAHAITVTAD
jgi:ferredoxin